MRRHVRFSALGRSRSVTLHFSAGSCEAEVLDESADGLGLKVQDASGLSVGQAVVVEGGEARVDAAVLRIEPLADGGTLVGVHLDPIRPGAASS